MENVKISNILNSIFKFKIPHEGLDGGRSIEDLEISKLIRVFVIAFKPTNKDRIIEILCFNKALEMAAFAFSDGSDYCSFYAEKCFDSIENKILDTNIEDLVQLCYYYHLLNGFSEANLKFDDDTLLVNNTKTNEVISYANIQNLVLRLILNKLDDKINFIKGILRQDEHRKEITKCLAGSDKEEYIESATKFFDELMTL